MANELVAREAAELAEQVAIAGDLSKLSADQRMAYYGQVCKSLGLNPMTRPFQYITLNGKLTLYATRDATDQLRRLQRVSISIISRERIEDVYVVTARAVTPDGRTDESTGVVALGNAKGEMLANALMKAETKAKRRVTMSICGLGWMDESELDTVRSAQPIRVDTATGEILSQAPRLAEPINARDLLVQDLRQAYATAKRAGAQVDPPSKAEVQGWDESQIELAIDYYRSAAIEAQTPPEADETEPA